MSVVLEKTQLTPDIARLVIKDKDSLSYKAGQAFFLKIEPFESRPYSAANAPDKKSGSHILEFHIKRGAGISGHLIDHTKAGDHIEVSGPTGDVHFNTRCKKPILAIAGGTGLAQIKSICEAALQTSREAPVYLYHGGRAIADLYLRDYFKSLAEKDPRFLYKDSVSGAYEIQDQSENTPRHGLIGDIAAADFSDLKGFRAYLCGPSAMVAHTQSLILDKGIDPKRIHAENWLKG